MLNLLPTIAIILVCFSIGIIAKNKTLLANWGIRTLFLFNIIFLVGLTTIFVLYILGELHIIPAWIFWLMIVAAIILSVYSIKYNSLPGHITSLALFLFSAFITLFSIGIIMLVLAIIQIFLIFINLRKLRRPSINNQ